MRPDLTSPNSQPEKSGLTLWTWWAILGFFSDSGMHWLHALERVAELLSKKDELDLPRWPVV